MGPSFSPFSSPKDLGIVGRPMPRPQLQDLVRAFEGRKLPVPRDDMMPSDVTEVGATSSHTKKIGWTSVTLWKQKV